jgi:hypothetical protein
MDARTRTSAISAGFCILAAVAIMAALGAAEASAATYYVSPAGRDGNRGTSSKAPLRTIRRVNRLPLRPGDKVLFRGGQTFSDRTLMPARSGSRKARIVYGSYGRGRPTIVNPGGAVWIPDGRSYLTFNHLELSTGVNSRVSILADSATGPGSRFITLKHSVLSDTGGAAIISKQHRDHGWRIANNAISHIGDSGLIIWGANAVIASNRISGTGWNTAIPWAKHGIYAKGPHMTIHDNVISDFGSDGVSLRFHDIKAYRNVVRGGAIAFAYFDYDTTAGTSEVRKNVASDVSVAGFYYAPDPSPSGAPPQESFVVRGNQFEMKGGTGIDVGGARYGNIELTGNVVRGVFNPALVASSPQPGRKYREHANRFLGSLSVVWNGVSLLPEAYRVASGQGVGSVFRPTH